MSKQDAQKARSSYHSSENAASQVNARVTFTATGEHCGEKLPELLRRLIAASASTITTLDFPSAAIGRHPILDSPASIHFIGR